MGSTPRLFVLIGVKEPGEPGVGRDAGGYIPSSSFWQLCTQRGNGVERAAMCVEIMSTGSSLS